MFTVWDARAHFCCIGKSMNIDFITYICSISAAGKEKLGIHLFFPPFVVFLSLLYPLFLHWFRPWPRVHNVIVSARVGWTIKVLESLEVTYLSVLFPSLHLSVSLSLFSFFCKCHCGWDAVPPTHPRTYPIPSAYLPTIHRSRPLLRARTPAWACVVRSDYRPLHCPRQVGPRHWPTDRG